MFAMIAEIKNIYVYTYWDYTEWRGLQLPDNIFEFISFPNRLKFISKEEFNKLENPELKYRWVYHGFDYIPETIYRSLYEDDDIKCTYNEMINIYRKVSKQLFFKKNLPIEFTIRPGIIHIRRDDKAQEQMLQKNAILHTNEIITIISKFKDKIQDWVITSDVIIPNEIIKEYNIPNLLEPKWSSDSKIKTLEQFFSYSHSKIIIQSVPGIGPPSGWSGFSYVPFQLGLSIYKDNLPILISCNDDSQNTRMTIASKYAEQKLLNIFMYNNLQNIKI